MIWSICFSLLLLFFFKQKTAYEMRISDWSSDVCSSDPVTFRVENVRDLNGNAIESPVTWTAYIDRNQLNWSDDRFDLTKELYKPLSFESHLLNSGGTDQQFTLENLPHWLKANPSGGTIDPQGNTQVVFTFNEGLNVGT